MKKANEEHPVYVSLRDWSKVRKENTVAEKIERHTEGGHHDNRRENHSGNQGL